MSSKTEKDSIVDESLSPVQVFIMLGQSNMVGMGQVGSPLQEQNGMLPQGSLRSLVKENPDKYGHLRDKDGNWTELSNVRYLQCVPTPKDPFGLQKNEWLKVEEGGPKRSPHFGPELGFGFELDQWMGQQDDDSSSPILLLKAAIGNRSLGWDLLPPNGERFEYDGKIYGGYRDVKGSWEKDETPPPAYQEGDAATKDVWYAGKQYDMDVGACQDILAHFQDYFPMWKKRTYEIAGFVWWQGHKDTTSNAYAQRYETNLVKLIENLRNDFHAPTAKFVCASIAFGGMENSKKKSHQNVFAAQLALNNYPKDFHVKSIDCRPFWRPREVSPNKKQGHHYFQNAETYYLVGEALGKAMIELLSES